MVAIWPETWMIAGSVRFMFDVEQNRIGYTKSTGASRMLKAVLKEAFPLDTFLEQLW